MDEPTLDCHLCGEPGWLEARLERLDDAAEWRRTNAWVVCERHTSAVDVSPRYLLGNTRLILQRCG